MDIDFDTITEYQRYKLMASLIVPRPVAFVTTLNDDGSVNAAPFSMFCMLGEEPPLLLVSFNYSEGQRRKDTARNIEARGEFVVHMVDEDLVRAADSASEQLPYGESELTALGLALTPSVKVAVPTIVASPVAFECVLHETIRTTSREIVIGRIVSLRVDDGLVDTETWRVRLGGYFPIARFGASFYTTTRDRFSLVEPDGNGAVLTATQIDQL
jgi:flavin reductase (DIM6/NTAB) family NADH-FMN oxidoreductase RutF